MTAARRALEEMIGELAGGLLPLVQGRAVRPVSLDFALPIEARVDRGPAGLRVIADLPRLHTRTDFDLPVGRLTLTLGAVTEASG